MSAHRLFNVRRGFVTLHPFTAVGDGHDVLAFCPNPVVAARIAQLLDEHGLVDVPDHWEDE